MKTCIRCGEEKPLSAFYRRRSLIDYLTRYQEAAA